MDWIVLFTLAFITTTISFNLGLSIGKTRGRNEGVALGWQQYERDMLPMMVSTAIARYAIEQGSSDDTRSESD